MRAACEWSEGGGSECPIFEGYLQQPMSAGLAEFLPIGWGSTSFAIEVSIGQIG